MLYTIKMYSVIRHTFEVVNPEPKNLSSHKSYGLWKHYSWLFETYEEAMAEAIKMLDSPILKANEHYLAHAIECLEENHYFQVGRESVAVAEVINSNLFTRSKNEKHLH